MSRAHSVVEVNGNRYDAATGKLVGTVKKSAHQLRSSAGGVVDGFIRQSSQTHLRKNAPRQRTKHTAQAFHRTAERSRTLMRAAVKKPTTGKTDFRPQAGASTEKNSPNKPSDRHTMRARTVTKNSNVSRFGHVHKSAPKTAPVSGEIVSRAGSQKSAALAASPSMVASASHSHIERLLDQALTSNTHKKRPRSAHGAWHRIKFMPRWLSVGVAAFILTIAAAVFAWQNIPQVAVKVAAVRASINATAPGYTPEGYRFAAPVNYDKGQVKIRYSSGSGQKYEVIQQTSKLDSASLASTILSTEANVQTSQVKGNTVYIYGDKNNATWVNNGVRYTIADHAGLSSDQVLNIAGSL